MASRVVSRIKLLCSWSREVTGTLEEYMPVRVNGANSRGSRVGIVRTPGTALQA